MGSIDSAGAGPPRVDLYRSLPGMNCLLVASSSTTLVLVWPWPADLDASEVLVRVNGEYYTADAARTVILPEAPEPDRRLAVLRTAGPAPAGAGQLLDPDQIAELAASLTKATDWSTVLRQAYSDYPHATAVPGPPQQTLVAPVDAAQPSAASGPDDLGWLCQILGID